MKRTPIKRRRTPLKRVYVRNGGMVVCETCKREFYASPAQLGKRRYCSRTCMGTSARAERTCTVCKAKFESRGPRKTCSTRCRNEAVRRGKLGTRNPAYRSGSRSNARWRSAKATYCARRCSSGSRIVQHHVVYEQHVRKRGGDAFDPDDSLTLCWDCHSGHHHGADRRIHVNDLRPENLRFALTLLGAYAADYLFRYYDGTRGEIGRRLEEESKWMTGLPTSALAATQDARTRRTPTERPTKEERHAE